MILKEKAFLFFQEMVEKRNSFLFYLFWPFFKFCSFIYFLVEEARNFLYDKKIFFFKSQKFSIKKVISVGNIVAGGTGKTPFTIFLTKKLLAKGYKVAVISKGYGSNYYKQNKSTFFSGRDKNVLPQDVGDEPYLISQNALDALIIVGKDKAKSLKLAEKENVDIAILDDGFQSRYIHRDVDIVLLDGKIPFSNGNVLPSGFLRESKKNIKRADLKVYTYKGTTENKNISQIDKKSLYVKFNISSFSEVNAQENNKKFYQDNFLNKEIAVLCAIAKPKSFINMLKKMDFKIVYSKFLFDHSSFTLNELNSFARSAKEKGAKSIIMTEKDAVKLPPNIDIILPLYYTRLDLEIIYNKNILDNLIYKIL